MPLRALLAALVLAGFGLWQGWQCTDGMAMAAPVFSEVFGMYPCGSMMGGFGCS